MRRKKALPTQRRLAQRRGLVILCLALLCAVGWCFLNRSVLTPSLVIRNAERHLACGPTERLAQRKEQGETFLLSQNDNVLMLNLFSPALWTSNLRPGQPLFSVERTKVSGPAAVGEYQFHDGRAQRGDLHVAGILTGCPEAVSVRLCLPERPGTPSAEVSILENAEGIRYFWYYEPHKTEEFLPGYTTALLLDKAGVPLASCPITDPGNYSSHYGGHSSPFTVTLPPQTTS